MTELAKSIAQLAISIFKYVSDAKSRHTRAALHTATRIQHIDQLLDELQGKDDKKSITLRKNLKAKKKKLWDAFDKHIAAN